MKLRQVVAVCCMGLFALCSVPLLAQAGKKKAKTKSTIKAPKVITITGKDRTVYKKVTKIDFLQSRIGVDLVRPKEMVYRAKGRTTFTSLIRLRKSFKKELLKSAKNM